MISRLFKRHFVITNNGRTEVVPVEKVHLNQRNYGVTNVGKSLQCLHSAPIFCEAPIFYTEVDVFNQKKKRLLQLRYSFSDQSHKNKLEFFPPSPPVWHMAEDETGDGIPKEQNQLILGDARLEYSNEHNFYGLCISSPPGNVISYSNKIPGPRSPTIVITNSLKETQLRITPKTDMGWATSARIGTEDGEMVLGKISRDLDRMDEFDKLVHATIVFPSDMAVYLKLSVIAITVFMLGKSSL